MAMPPRVVITGMGWVTPLGHDVPSGWSGLLEGRNAIGPVAHFDASTWGTSFAAEVRDFRLADFLDDTTEHERGGLNTRFALGAAAQAWKQAGLDRSEERRVG